LAAHFAYFQRVYCLLKALPERQAGSELERAHQAVHIGTRIAARRAAEMLAASRRRLTKDYAAAERELTKAYH
jgi:hypothetical protein